MIESNSIIPAQFSNYPLAFGGLSCNGTEANLNQCSISGDVVAICDKDKGNFGPDSSTVIMSCICKLYLTCFILQILQYLTPVLMKVI